MSKKYIDIFVIISTISLIFASFSVHAKMYKWVDDKGEVHYGDTVPPEYAGSQRKELSHSGTEVQQKKDGKKGSGTDKELSAEEQEKVRHDKALLATYSSIKEIELARKRNTQQLEEQIDSLKRQLEIVNRRAVEYRGNMASLKKEGKPIPPSLARDLEDSQKEVNRVDRDIAKRQKDLAEINAQFDADVARYKELTSGAKP